MKQTSVDLPVNEEENSTLYIGTFFTLRFDQ